MVKEQFYWPAILIAMIWFWVEGATGQGLSLVAKWDTPILPRAFDQNERHALGKPSKGESDDETRYHIPANRWPEEVHFILRHHPEPSPDKKETLPSPFAETQELKIIGMAMIRFYQLFISSQQNNQSVCIFTPSCSRFGLQAIRKYGIWQGVLMTSDRLQRCHGFAGNYYQRAGMSPKFFDPIERYDWRSYRK